MLFYLFLCLYVLIGVRGYSYQDDRSRVVYYNTTNNVINITLADPVATTPLGSIRGSWLQTRGGRRFQAYRGVRYAEPPVGELRFQPPKPLLRYWSEVDATADGPACPSPASSILGVIDEDCLRLNVYTPGSDSNRRLPVIVFFPPSSSDLPLGRYPISARSTDFGPLYLLERNLVLVTVNYRLGALGFLSTGDEVAPGNNGLKDQVAALRWVRGNIASFGGDPGQVTIAGAGTGAGIFLHLVSPMSKGLFHRAISISGSPVQSTLPTHHHQRALAARQATLLGCPAYPSRAMLSCLKTKNWQEIGSTAEGLVEFGADPTLVWSPVVEPDFSQERFLPADPSDAIRKGYVHAVPFIITMSRNEFFYKAFAILNNAPALLKLNQAWSPTAALVFHLPEESPAAALWLRRGYLDDRPLGNDSVTARRLGRLFGDAYAGFGVHRLANLLCRNSPQPVYYGEFDYIGNYSHYIDPTSGRPTGAAHQDDLQYVFSQPAHFPVITPGSQDDRIVNRLTAIWYNFARFGNPNPHEDTPEIQDLFWPQMTPKNREYTRITRDFSVHYNLFEEYFQIWEELYPLQYSFRKEYLPYEFSSKILESYGYAPRLFERNRYVWPEVYQKIHLARIGDKIDKLKENAVNFL